MDGYNAPRTAIYRNEVYDLNRMWILLCEPKRGRRGLPNEFEAELAFSSLPHFHPSRIFIPPAGIRI
jgi:hypothetical protein